MRLAPGVGAGRGPAGGLGHRGDGRLPRPVPGAVTHRTPISRGRPAALARLALLAAGHGGLLPGWSALWLYSVSHLVPARTTRVSPDPCWQPARPGPWRCHGQPRALWVGQRPLAAG